MTLRNEDFSAPDDCPFCQRDRDRIVSEFKHWVAIRDGFPIAEGHTLLVPRRHVESIFDLDDRDLAELPFAMASARQTISAATQADGFTIGINDGTAAGQTVTHAHVHIIPRNAGDVADPRGGVRWVLPDRARYWDDP